MSKPLKFRNAHVNPLGNIKFLKPGEESEKPVVSSDVKSVKSSVVKSESDKMQNSTFTSISPAGASTPSAGQVQVITSQGTPVISGSSIIVPQMGPLPVLQNTTNPLILQRTTYIHGTGKTPAEAGQTFPLVPCVGSTFPANSTVQLIQNQPATNIQIVQNPPSQNIQILQNQPQASVQILQNPHQGSIQFVQSQPQTQTQANFQVLSNQSSGVQLISNSGHAQGSVQVIQQPTMQMVQDLNGRLQLISPGSLPSVITLQRNTNGVPPQIVPPKSDMKHKDGNVRAVSKDVKSSPKETNEKSNVKKSVNSSKQGVLKSGVLRQLLTPKFGTTGLKKAEYKISTDNTLVRRKAFRKKKKKGLKMPENMSTKLPELLPKKTPPLEKTNTQNNNTSVRQPTADEPDGEGSVPKMTAISQPGGEILKKSDEKAESDEDLVVIINKEQQNDNSEDAKLSFAGTSVKPKFAIEFSPNNLQAYVQAVANAVENHKALFEQNKSDTKHKKKKSKHKSKDLEADFEMVFEPPREVATVSKSSRRKQTLSVRKDPSDIVTAVAEIPKPVSKKKQYSLLSSSNRIQNTPKPVPVPTVEKSTSAKKSSLTVNSGSIVSLRETAEDDCVDVVGDTGSQVGQFVPREVGVFLPQSISKSFVSTAPVQAVHVGGTNKVIDGDFSSKPKSGQSTVPAVTKISPRVVVPVETNKSSAELAISCGIKKSSAKEVNLPVPIDEIKKEPMDDTVSKPQTPVTPVDTRKQKRLLAGDVSKSKTVPSSTGGDKTLNVSKTSRLTVSSQQVSEGKKNVLPVPAQSIKEEPSEIVEVSPGKHMSLNRNLAFNSGQAGNLAATAKSFSPLKIPVATCGMKTQNIPQQSSEEKTVKSKLKDKIRESKSVSHHHSPVKEATALQKVFTAFAQETQASTLSGPKNKLNNLKSPQLTTKQRSIPKNVTPKIGSSPKPPTLKFVPVPKVTAEPPPARASAPAPAPAPAPVPKVVQLGFTPDAVYQPLMTASELAKPVTPTVLPPQISAPQTSPAGPSSTSASTKNIAKLMGPFTLMPGPAPVPNLPLTSNANQQKQVFIVPNSVYSALLSAQASTGQTIQLTSSQLFAGKVLPPTVTGTSANTGNTPTSPVNLIANQDNLTLPVSIVDNATAQPKPVQQLNVLPLQGKQNRGKFGAIAGMSSLNVSLTTAEGAKGLKCSPNVSETKILTASSVTQPVQLDSDKSGEELGKQSFELKIDSVFSLNKVSCKLLDKVPSYLDMCLNSKHERSLKLCFVVLDKKMPPLFRGKTGTKRTRLVAPKVCPTQCRTDALDFMCGENKWPNVKLSQKGHEEEFEPVIKRAKPGRPRKKTSLC